MAASDRSTDPGPTAPVLVLVYNRPEVTRRLFAALRDAGVSELYVAADGPRAGDPSDAERCAAVRAVVDGVDWPCAVHRLDHPANAGLQASVVAGLDWFFGEVDAGIVLEDDCLPAPAWFPFATELLERYAAEPRVMHISAVNMAEDTTGGGHSYLFADVGHIWGWATWRRAWARFDADLDDWPDRRGALGVADPRLRRALGRKFAAARSGRKWTWSRAWYWTLVRDGGLAVIPSANLVENVGVGDDATHRSGRRHPLRRPTGRGLSFPLDHPPELVADEAYGRLLARYHDRSFAARTGDRVLGVLDPLTGRARRR